MIYRMGAAVMSLLGVFVSAYLYLYKIGRIGTLACGTGGCETVQQSTWSRFLGVEVALIGLIGYGALLVTALISLQATSPRAWAPRVLAWLAAGGVLFTVYLTSLELFVIHAICRWCVGSAVIIVSVLVLALLDRRHATEPRAG